MQCVRRLIEDFSKPKHTPCARVFHFPSFCSSIVAIFNRFFTTASAPSVEEFLLGDGLVSFDWELADDPVAALKARKAELLSTGACVSVITSVAGQANHCVSLGRTLRAGHTCRCA